MTDPAYDDLTLRVLHGFATDEERATLAHLLGESAENRRRFLDHSALHGMLSYEAKTGAFASDPATHFHKLEKPRAAKPKRLLSFWLPTAAAVVVACFALLTALPTNASAAIDRMITAMSQVGDRTYRIEMIDPAPGNSAPRSDRGRFPPAAHLDGATLWMRGSDSFVLRQSLPNGQTRLLGGDGVESWTQRGDGPVRVSSDPKRFAGAIFARNGEIAFLDLRSQLDELKRLYDVEWLDRSTSDVHKILATRRSADQGGPREIELWFDPETGLPGRLILRHLPRGNGGPRSIAIILESTDPLPSDFFRHTHHYSPDHEILPEP